jgi:DsbC/DsbD-like thiol-disulfide interchange protein
MARMISRCTALLLTATICASPALASSSEWHKAEGGRVRLVTSGKADTEGRLKGALQIELKSGWKTYWRDPGASGVPPSIDVSTNPLLVSADIDFPAPEHHFDGTATWAGYDRSIALPVTFQMRGSGSPGVIDASVFLGICETICVPVQANLAVDTRASADDPADATTVASAWAALPAAATAEFGARLVAADTKTVTVEIAAPGGAEQAELFLAGEEGYLLGLARKLDPTSKLWKADIIARPKAKPSNEGLHYTLVTPSGAVSGLLPYF